MAAFEEDELLAESSVTVSTRNDAVSFALLSEITVANFCNMTSSFPADVDDILLATTEPEIIGDAEGDDDDDDDDDDVSPRSIDTSSSFVRYRESSSARLINRSSS